jgi:CRISPR/Cas system-associated exonuclease Cas4 (RecB family)
VFQKLPDAFKFSQSNLQDYVDCPRRFQLRYVESQAWPGVQAEPLLEHERHLERGAEFHRLVERHQLGVDASLLSAGISDPDLLAWWRAYLGFEYLHRLGGKRYPEYTLSARVGAAVLVATFDLLVVGERVVIFDWKTYSRRPALQWFESRLQTRVYPFVVCSSGFGGGFSFEQVSMVYWLSGVPEEPVIIEYDSRRFEGDRRYLEGLVSGVGARLSASEEIWPLTADVVRCGFCEFRSLCGRGVVAGVLDVVSNSSGNIAVEGGLGLGLFDVEELSF